MIFQIKYEASDVETFQGAKKPTLKVQNVAYNQSIVDKNHIVVDSDINTYIGCVHSSPLSWWQYYECQH